MPTSTPPPPDADPSAPARPALDVARLSEATGADGWRVEVVATSASTNAEAATRSRQGAGAGLVVVAEHQTAGRGRLGRAWLTPPRSALTLSVVLQPASVPAERWPWLPLLVGVALARSVRRTCGLDARLKWPNDVLLPDLPGSRGGRGGKVAGILLERLEASDPPGARHGQGARAVVGIGLNVSTTPAELPTPGSTSLELAGAGPVDRTGLLLDLLASLEEVYRPWCAVLGDPTAVRAAYLELCDTLGREVRVSLPSGPDLRGRARGVDTHGRLEVEHASGLSALGVGDVVHVRPG